MKRRRNVFLDPWFTFWFIFCAALAISGIVFAVVVVLNLLGHVTGALDRVGQ